MKRLNESEVRSVVKALDKIAKTHGMEITRRGVNRWATAMRMKKSLEREKRELRKRMSELTRKLR